MATNTTLMGESLLETLPPVITGLFPEDIKTAPTLEDPVQNFIKAHDALYGRRDEFDLLGTQVQLVKARAGWREIHHMGGIPDQAQAGDRRGVLFKGKVALPDIEDLFDVTLSVATEETPDRTRYLEDGSSIRTAVSCEFVLPEGLSQALFGVSGRRFTDKALRTPERDDSAVGDVAREHTLSMAALSLERLLEG